MHIPNVGRGQVKYVGPVDTKPGIYAGIDLLANIGKNDGSFREKKYFETEYPQSGLFIQLQKVATLIENAHTNGSRRSTGAPESSIINNFNDGSRVTSSGSTGSTVIRRHAMTDTKSPTPMRDRRVSGRVDIIENHPSKTRSSIGEAEMLAVNNLPDYEGDVNMVPPSSVPNRSVNDNSPSSRLLHEYEMKIEKQDREILRYKTLLDDQRMVLEEIQPTIDGYESNLHEMELEMNRLRHYLNEEREQQRKQKQFFETEHEQLLAVVDELHEEIKANEKRVMAEQSNRLEKSAVDPCILKELAELQNVVEQGKRAKLEWLQEREQLKAQNESLSEDYQALNQAFIQLQNDGAEKTFKSNASNQVERIEKELNDAHKKILHREVMLEQQNEIQYHTNADHVNAHEIESLPLYESKHKMDVTAGRDLWCALCEKDGHESIDCPYELLLGGEKASNIPSSPRNQLLF